MKKKEGWSEEARSERDIFKKKERWDERMGLGINEKGLSEKEGRVEEVSRMN